MPQESCPINVTSSCPLIYRGHSHSFPSKGSALEHSCPKLGISSAILTGTPGKEALDVLKGHRAGGGGWEGTHKVFVPTPGSALKWGLSQPEKK